MRGWDMRHDDENGTYFVSPVDEDVALLRFYAEREHHFGLTSIADRIERIIGA